MADEADIAQRFNEQFDRRAIAALRASMPQGESATECIECGDEIPEARRTAVAGCLRCITCQSAVERL